MIYCTMNIESCENISANTWQQTAVQQFVHHRLKILLEREYNMEKHIELQWFRELIRHSSGISSQIYSPSGDCLETNDTNALLPENIFIYTSCREIMVQHFRRYTEPLLLSAPLGMQWAAAAEIKQGEIYRIHVLGPVLSGSISHQNIKRRFSSFSPELTEYWGDGLNLVVALFDSLSIVTSNELKRLTILLHDCVNQESVSPNQIHHQNCSHEPENIFADAENDPSIVWDWESEQKMLMMIREGNLAYREQLAGSALFEQLWQPNSFSSLQQAQMKAVSLITLCTRAAVEGGLLADTAYATADYYIHDTQVCRSSAEVVLIIQTMYNDLIQRVYKHKRNHELSKPVHDCCSYIEQHVEDILSVSLLAKRFGYAEYYFTQKFKKETGTNLRDFIQQTKIERAKFLLRNSNLSIQQISDALHFSSRNYFYTVFRKVVGVPPAKYRLLDEKDLRAGV